MKKKKKKMMKKKCISKKYRSLVLRKRKGNLGSKRKWVKEKEKL
jgi:hypothetical protein